jgi:hypothetical protein
MLRRHQRFLLRQPLFIFRPRLFVLLQQPFRLRHQLFVSPLLAADGMAYAGGVWSLRRR